MDQLWQFTALSPQVDGDSQRLAELSEAGIALAGYAAENPQPGWIDKVQDDAELLEKLAEELKKWRTAPPPAVAPAPQPTAGPSTQPAAFQSFGVGDRIMGWLSAAGNSLKQAAIDIPNDFILEQFRPGLTNNLILFFGDVFSYLAERGTDQQPGKVPARILADLQKARNDADARNEKLVVVSHSMGGNIMYDILTYFTPNLVIDDFITVGCQASVFKQLQLFKGQDNNIRALPGGAGAPKAPKPKNVGRWLNIFDPQDILSFAFEPEFEGVSDFYFESPGGTFTAHGDYFKRIRFYERLLARLTA